MSLIPKIPRASAVFAPLGPLPGLYPGPAGDLKRSPDPSPTHAPPNHKSWIRPCQWCEFKSRRRKNKNLAALKSTLLLKNVNVQQITKYFLVSVHNININPHLDSVGLMLLRTA
jgi:hypothetical protein